MIVGDDLLNKQFVAVRSAPQFIMPSILHFSLPLARRANRINLFNECAEDFPQILVPDIG